jgi:hypothetical protein
MSAYVANNPILYNAALSGIIDAAGAGANPSGTGTAVTAANAEAVAAALPLAQAIDALITGDATITSAGATIVIGGGGSTAAEANAVTSKRLAMYGCAFAAMQGQSNAAGALPAAAQAAIAAGVAAKYAALIAAPFSLL